MTIIVHFFVVSLIFGAHQTASENDALSSTSTATISLFTESHSFEPWVGHLTAAPAIINHIGHLMVIAGTVNTSLQLYSVDQANNYIKYPKTFTGSVLQISNEVYRAFLNAHSSMNKIYAYMKRIPQHVQAVKKVLLIKASTKLINQTIINTMNDMKRINDTCVSLSKAVQNSFESILKPCDEMMKVIATTKSKYEIARTNSQIDLNGIPVRRDFTQIIETLVETTSVLSRINQECYKLLLFFLNFVDDVVVNFGERLQRFFDTVLMVVDVASSMTNRKFALEILSQENTDLNRASYLPNVISRAYYDISSEYLMPRLPTLFSISTNENQNDRKGKIFKLTVDTSIVQNLIKTLLEEREKVWKKAISNK